MNDSGLNLVQKVSTKRPTHTAHDFAAGDTSLMQKLRASMGNINV